jgi:large subunit ribosomal protein L15
MRIEDLRPASGSRKNPKRVGRGPGSGHGKTATRGHKGQKARAGGGTRPGFEGGQMPLQRRLPKRGFKNKFGIEYSVLNLKKIDALGLDAVTPEALLEQGVMKSLKDGLKILGDGELKKPVNIRAHAFSASALKKITASGGSAEVI